MALLSVCRRYARRIALFAVLGVITAVFLLQPSVTDAAADGNNPPTNIACQGWQRDTVLISFRDNDNDEVNYRLERSIDGAAFTEIATINKNDGGGYDGYFDLAIDVAKNYRYRVRGAHGDGSFTDYSPICSNRRIFDTSNVANNGFRIFYGLEGTTDSCPAIDGNDVCLANMNPLTVQQNALEGSADALTRLGFDRDAAVPNGGLDKIPVNVVWCDGGGCAGGSSLGLSPLLLEMPFDLTTRVGDPIAYLVSEHEVFHFQQFKYSGLKDPAGGWVIEGQARSSQDKVCIGADRPTALCFDDIATGTAGYVPEINAYLGNPNRPINQTEYQAALFWTYLVEKFGTSAPGDTVEEGMNLMSEFWKNSAATPNRDGIAVLNETLADLGTPMRFRDVWKDFAVANYAKNLTGAPVPAKYKYDDMAQPGGNYDPVAFTVNQPLALNVPFLRLGETVRQWGAQYYRFTPAANVPVLDIRVTQDSNTPIYYTVLGVRANAVVHEFNVEGRNLNHTLLNNAFDEVVIVVAGLENLANYRVSVNGTTPTLRILSPTTANNARVGSFAAPEKFRVAVQVLAGDGTPLSGVDLGSFNFRVGTVDVPDDLIITSALIQDQQWFVLRAPVQAAAGQYDLSVNYANNASLVATQTLAVNYAPRVDADNMIVVDDSGSMAGPKIQAAKSAARLYVDSWRVGDRVGVIGFDNTPDLSMQLEPWTSPGTREQAFAAIDGLVDDGATAIGDALMLGLGQLQGRGDPAHDWGLILLSDGVEEGPNTVNLDTAIGNIAGLTTKRPVIHAIAVGPNADGPRMQAAATATGGTYQFVSAPVAVSTASSDGTVAIESMMPMVTTAAFNTPDAPTVLANPRLDLNARYRYIATEMLGHQEFVTKVGPVNDGDFFKEVVNVAVEGSAAEITFSLSFVFNCVCNISLVVPGIGALPPAVIDNAGRHYLWRLATPPPGTWVLTIEQKFIGPKAASVDAPQQSEQIPEYLVQAAVKSDLILDVDLPVPAEDRVTGVPMPIVASLTEFGPVTGANAVAFITKPDGDLRFLILYDDGAHGDGVAGDGVYANTFYETGAGGTEAGAGSYSVNLLAGGSTPNAGTFNRQKTLGFFIYGSGDDDGDLLPNEYETLHTGNPKGTGSPTELDPAGDPDGDGRTTLDEFLEGTDPFDADSDDGGEGDGSEYNNTTDPHDASDDDVQPTTTVAYPGDSKVFVRYAPRPEYLLIEIRRSDSFEGPYTFLDQLSDSSGLYTDTTVTNDQEYCYFVVGITVGGEQSAPGTPSCATPKADPWAPDGGFLINGGASNTDSQEVMLDIFASDSVSPHIHEGDAIDEIMTPPSDSATEVTQMRVSNRADMAGAEFEPYNTTKAWILGTAQGLATVYMQFRDAAGNDSRIVPNSILVDDDTPVPQFDEDLMMPFLRRQ